MRLKQFFIRILKLDRKDKFDWLFILWISIFFVFFFYSLLAQIFKLPLYNLGIDRDSFTSIFTLLATISSGILAIFVAAVTLLAQYHISAIRNCRLNLVDKLDILNSFVTDSDLRHPGAKKSLLGLIALCYGMSLATLSKPLSASYIDGKIRDFRKSLNNLSNEIDKAIKQLGKRQKQLLKEQSGEIGNNKDEYALEETSIAKQITSYHKLNTQGLVTIDIIYRLGFAIISFTTIKASVKIIAVFALYVMLIFGVLLINNIEVLPESDLAPSITENVDSPTTNMTQSVEVQRSPLVTSSGNISNINTSENQTQTSVIGRLLFDDSFRLFLTIHTAIFMLSGILLMSFQLLSVGFGNIQKEVGKIE